MSRAQSSKNDADVRPWKYPAAAQSTGARRVDWMRAVVIAPVLLLGVGGDEVLVQPLGALISRNLQLALVRVQHHVGGVIDDEQPLLVRRDLVEGLDLL